MDIGKVAERIGAKPVLVAWDDAAHQFGWLDGEEVEVQDSIVHTVGWLLKRTDQMLIIGQSLTGGGHAQTLQIPAGMVRSVTFLGEA